MDHLFEALRLAGLLIGVGVTAQYVRRRREAAAAPIRR